MQGANLSPEDRALIRANTSFYQTIPEVLTMRKMLYAHRKKMMLIVGLVLFVAFGYSLYRFYRSAQFATNRIIAEQVKTLVHILKKIDDTCGIVAITRDRSVIDFLNVKSFAGSEIGPLNLMEPKKWAGPYLETNYAIQGKLYEIIRTKEGYFVVPGEGVKLSSGKVIGKDIVFTYDTDVEAYVNDAGGLEYDGNPMAMRLHLKKEGSIPTGDALIATTEDEGV